MAFTPHPNDDAAADAPLLLAVTLLTTGTNVGVTSVRIGAVPTVTPLTNEAVGAVTLATPAPVVGVTLVTTVCEFGVPLTTGAFSRKTLFVPPGALVVRTT